MSILEKAWEQREEKVYIELFGCNGSEIYNLDSGLFRNKFNCKDIDPLWLNFGVLKFEPTPSRKTWIYVSSGMSNPWGSDGKEEYSGFGVEFVLETYKDESWGVEALRVLVAYNVLIANGNFGEQDLINYGHRLKFSLAPNISHFLVLEPSHYRKEFELISGRVNLLHFLGISNSEYEYAKQEGSLALTDALYEKDIYPVTNPERPSIF